MPMSDDDKPVPRRRFFRDGLLELFKPLARSVEPMAPRHPVPLRVVYHDACHLGHAQGVREQPRELPGASCCFAVRRYQ